VKIRSFTLLWALGSELVKKHQLKSISFQSFLQLLHQFKLLLHQNLKLMLLQKFKSLEKKRLTKIKLQQ
jgi:hypothetical protein